MNKVIFHYGGGRLTRTRDAALILGNEDPLETLVEAAIESIGLDVEIECGGVSMPLAMWRDPDHWSEDWREAGIEDVSDFVASLVEAMP